MRKRHGGLCWKATCACARCVSKEHGIQNCPQIDQGQHKSIGDDTKACYHSRKTGHYKRECRSCKWKDKWEKNRTTDWLNYSHNPRGRLEYRVFMSYRKKLARPVTSMQSTTLLVFQTIQIPKKLHCIMHKSIRYLAF